MYKRKREWVGHVARLKDNQWTFRLTNRVPLDHKRAPRRPELRWADPMVCSSNNGNDVRRTGTDGSKSTCVNGEVREDKSDTEYRGSSEEDEDYPASRSPSRHCCPSCFDVRPGELDSTEAGLARCHRYSERIGKDDAAHSLCTQVQRGTRSSELRHRTKIRYALDYAKKSKIRRAGHAMRYSDDGTRVVTEWIPRDVRRTPGRPPTRWPDFFTKAPNERNAEPRVLETRTTHWTTLARDRNEWSLYWRMLEEIDDHGTTSDRGDPST
uniref:Uncharacterized protein n=1 Tax=Haemonchus contortus TaxID=6289 RepID=A0A7I5EE82_HAECO